MPIRRTLRASLGGLPSPFAFGPCAANARGPHAARPRPEPRSRAAQIAPASRSAAIACAS
ncbi:hypothetical protein WI94_29145 [Burkholderia vietnamiensis]|nr:hypothetical protein WI94_29145 [Burkholderia vietnamiensis]KVE85657.1 hypothetical protein WJ00_14865 [Burkholderia vietnamiensis]